MLALVTLLLLQPQAPIAQLDALAQKRDVAGLAKWSSPAVVASKALDFLKHNGAYDTGRFGWRAIELKDAAGPGVFVVFSTKLTSEDIGEQVFRWRNGKLDASVPELDSLGFRVERHDLDVRFDLPAKKAIVTDTATFRREKGSGGSFLVRMCPWFRVGAVADAKGKPVRFAQAGGVVSLPAPTGNAPFTYTLRYAGVVDLPRYAGSVSDKEVLLANDYWYPMIARQASPYSVTVHHPKDWIAVAQGERVSIVEGANEKVTKWRMDLPIVYFSLSAAPFKEYRQTIRGHVYSVWSMVMEPEEMKLQTELFAPVFEFYERSFGKSPFNGYGAVVSDVYGGGALEAYSYATYGTGWLPDQDAHEPAHTWWGGMIPNTYLRSLWNESFAVFSDGLFHREGGAGDREAKRLAFVQDAEPNPAYLTASCADGGASVGPAASALGYGKGGMVLQMLENEIGTDKMVEACRTWVARHKRPQVGEWEDFEKVVAQVAGDHKWFFDQWIRRTGWADFDVTDVRWDGSAVVGNVVFKGPGYRLTLETMLESPLGARRFTRVVVPAAGGTIRIPAADKPALVSFDPWQRLLRRAEADETPVQLRNHMPNKRYRDPAHPDWMAELGGRRSGPGLKELPEDLSDTLIIGSPESLPAMGALCAKAGFVVAGNKLTWNGTTVDLDRGGAMAVVDLGSGKTCTIALGKTRLAPETGRARLALFDENGRFLAGVTEPKTGGFLTARL
ncbi:MAG: hypothetical protein M9921_10060 [Fimbriimonadaceae bacterium]|nr:hypothetical protein [Fimbriimonadaceae bacterium]